MSRVAAISLAVLVLASSGTAVTGEVRRTAARAHCRTVHGRLALYNGTFSYRIWLIGTHRVVAVVDEAGENVSETAKLPAPLAALLVGKDPFSARVFADYRICDFTEQRPGVMQGVTLVDARNIRIEVTE